MILQKGVKHVAVMWLKDKANYSRALELITEMSEIPHVIDITVGGPLDTDWGFVIDQSFDIGFVATFKDRAACRAYFDHPIHQKNGVQEMRSIAERGFACYIEF